MREFANHKQWRAVKEVADRLSQSGYQVYLAGGCVRDFLMKRAPNDFDLATDASPDQVAELFPKALMVGRAFGVSILPFGDYQLEVATFREDLEYKDGRRPEGVRFSTPEADSRRRDFTVNALFFDLNSETVIDFVGGQDDIKRRVIRTVGDPEQRFAEDKLRLLRAVRFAAQLEFTIAPETQSAIQRHAAEINVVSRERVRDEMIKLLKTSERVTGLSLMLQTGLMRALFPELEALIRREPDRWLARFGRGPLDSDLALALFYYPLAETMAERELREKHLKALRLDGRAIEAIQFALTNFKIFLDPKSVRKGELILLLAHPGAETALALASILEGQPLGGSERARELSDMALLALGPERKKPTPFVGGEDAQALGVKPGPSLGRLLAEAYLLQLEGKFDTRGEALEWLKAKIKTGSAP